MALKNLTIGPDDDDEVSSTGALDVRQARSPSPRVVTMTGLEAYDDPAPFLADVMMGRIYCTTDQLTAARTLMRYRYPVPAPTRHGHDESGHELTIEALD